MPVAFEIAVAFEFVVYLEGASVFLAQSHRYMIMRFTRLPAAIKIFQRAF